ncbi:hypothetical protein MKQ68_00790 [Chitinophaga horti]|uniref:RNA polymerase sigma-70 region 2 domain-containing protein n=1 Tax=Chitinophaga horti TaxID=2920382 RepID=A0ABY6J1U3_9BACT|nr:sigma factor [Chitinophaga horti]UYQ93636.1 hypothetical protein MKQ68_00790 [Chitinophaga horti]
MPTVVGPVARRVTFDEALKDIYPVVRNAVKKTLGTTHNDVDDITQDVMELMVRIFDTPIYARIENPKAFFYTAARNRAISSIRQTIDARAKWETYVANAKHPVMVIDLDFENIPSLFRQLYHYRIPTLMQPRRWMIFEYRYAYGLSTKKIAEIIGRSDDVVRFQLSLASGEVISAMRRILHP